MVDNCSVDGSAAHGAALGATVIELDGRVSRLRNSAALVARGELLAFIDADHELDQGWVTAAAELFRDGSVAAAGAPYVPPATANWVQRGYDLLRDHRPGVRDAAWLGSGNLVVRREVFTRVGCFDERLETCEDVDLCQRFTQAGFRILSDSRLKSTHYGDPRTLARLWKSELWRGRDNLRVSLRALSWRELPSVLIPILQLVATCVVIAGLASGGRRGFTVATAALAGVLSLTALRAWRMASRLERPGLVSLGQAACVAFFYDAARAMALVVRMPHRRVNGPVTTE